MSVRVACAVLAAGASRRLGRPKQLLMHRGQPLVVAAAECACQSQASACAVISGAHAGAVSAALSGLAIELVANPDWSEGVASSIRAATRWAKARSCQALIIALCDQPKLTAQHLDRLIGEYDRCLLPVASYYARKKRRPRTISRSELRRPLGALRRRRRERAAQRGWLARHARGLA